MNKIIKETKALYMRALIYVIVSFAETRVYIANRSIRFFAWYYFGLILFSCQERWAFALIKTRRGLVLAPAGHGKTEIASKILPLWRIVKDRNIRILIVAKSDGLAMKNLKVMSYELRYNKKLIRDYGRFYDRDNKWDQHQIEVIRDKVFKDPTVEAVGMGGAITGGRFDIEIFDDIIDILSVLTEAVRAKTVDYVDGTLIPRLEPWGVVWAIGTRKHYDDIYNHFLTNPVWSCIEEKAIISEPKEWDIIKRDEPRILEDGTEQWYEAEIASENRGEALCEEKWSMLQLLLHRFTIGSIVFDREYQNIIMSDEMSLFKLSWMESCKDANLSYIIGSVNEDIRRKYVSIIQGVDTALVTDEKKAETKDSDYNVIITLGLTKDGHRDLLKLYRKRGLSPKGVETAIKVEYSKVEPEYCFLEVNSFGIIHAYNIIHGTGMRLVKHWTGTNKSDLYQGVPGLSVLFENAKYRLPWRTAADRKKTNLFINEFYRLGAEKHDDIVMATWIAESGVLRYLKGQAKLRQQKEGQRPSRERTKRK